MKGIGKLTLEMLRSASARAHVPASHFGYGRRANRLPYLLMAGLVEWRDERPFVNAADFRVRVTAKGLQLLDKASQPSPK